MVIKPIIVYLIQSGAHLRKNAYSIGLKDQKGSKNNASKLSEEQVLEIINLLLAKKYTQKEIGNHFNVSEDCIGAIKNKKNWKYLTENIDFN